MNRKIVLIAFAIIFTLSASAQKLNAVVDYVTNDGTANSNIIFYQPGQLLTWDDFKGTPLAGSDAAALTNAGFGIKLAFHRVENTAQLHISVNCNFSRKDSWVKDGNKTAYILNHEQKHFDIAFIHTVLFIQKLKDASLDNNNYTTVIGKIYNEMAAAMSKMQNQYDDETSHSRNAERQSVWNVKISQQLAASLVLQGL